MIVQRAGHPGLRVAADGADQSWTCLARRGMLHSECEAVDLLSLRPGAGTEHRASDDVDEAVYVLDGTGTLTVDGESRPVSAGRLALLRHDAGAVITAGPDGLRLLSVRVLPRAVSEALPPRVPELPPAERTAS
jgi:redox-sensitive bicupin YhaK (pirin superfamily)